MPDNLCNRCKKCQSEVRKLNYDPVKARHSWKRNKYSAPELSESRRLMAAYGISVYVRDYMIKIADYKCEICDKNIKLVVDHDHDTGNVRGMLCSKCNRGLGHFDDNITLLTKAIKYITIKSEQNNIEFRG